MMKPTKKLFQVVLVRDNQSSPSRWFQNESQAQFYCSEYNRIVNQERIQATYQQVELPVGRRKVGFN